MQRRAPLRPSFVITLAATTALGCGTTTSPGDSGVQPDAPAIDIESSNPPPVCPPSAPTESDLCPYGAYFGGALRCHYDPCGDRFATEAVCYGFGNGVTWTVARSSCNPPPPMCPASPPDDGAACTLPATSCAWGTCRATCTDGRWAFDAPCFSDAGVPVDR